MGYSAWGGKRFSSCSSRGHSNCAVWPSPCSGFSYFGVWAAPLSPARHGARSSGMLRARGQQATGHRDTLSPPLAPVTPWGSAQALAEGI